jgi:ethanolamine ammonia-lyase small subunit
MADQSAVTVEGTAETTLTEDQWQAWRQHTRARIALGRAGAAVPTRELLDFGVSHAQARDAIHTALDVDALDAQLQQAGWVDIQRVHSQAIDRATYLRRPELGRALAKQNRLMPHQADVVVVIGDGLSSLAVQRHAVPLLQALRQLDAARWQSVPVVLASQARVALGDPIGQAMTARLLVMLIGERPGLSSPDSLGCYLTYQPKIDCSDAKRNCISNIRPEGLDYPVAAFKLDWLVQQALVRQLTGVDLKDESDLLLLQVQPHRGLK